MEFVVITPWTRGSKTAYSQIRLDVLPAESAGELLDAVLGDDPGLEHLKQLLVKRGNPFFLEETIRTLVETQALRAGLGHLEAVEFLYETGLFPDLEYSFKHALTHEVAYGGLLREHRRALHARIVDAIETLHRIALAERSSGLPITPTGGSCARRRCTISGRPEVRRPGGRHFRTLRLGSSRRS